LNKVNVAIQVRKFNKVVNVTNIPKTPVNIVRKIRIKINLMAIRKYFSCCNCSIIENVENISLVYQKEIRAASFE
jgi:hypothetical protein